MSLVTAAGRRRDLADAGEMVDQSVSRGHHLALATARGVSLYEISNDSEKRLAELRIRGSAKSVGRAGSGWMLLQGYPEKVAIVTSAVLSPQHALDLGSDGAWVVAPLGGGSVIYDNERVDAWLVGSDGKARRFRWSETAPLGEVVAGRSFDSLWMTNGDVVRRPVGRMKGVRLRPVVSFKAFGRTLIVEPEKRRRWLLTVASGVAIAVLSLMVIKRRRSHPRAQ